jgi:hypothetical protein
MKTKTILAWMFVVLMCCNWAHSEHPVHPILRESATQVNLIPIEQRDDKYIKFLSASVKISVNGAAGSGTICYYDANSNWAYVLSCGHLWEGDKNYDPKRPEKAKIVVWYHNEKRLPEPKNYEAEALFWSNKRGYDASLVRFKPDWTPVYFPIASHFHETKGTLLNSMGCDGGKEVARYEVKFVEKRPPDLITELNSPRPGRSGGGLLTDEGKLVGVCWGTSDISSGNGIGYFTPISSIKKVLTSNRHEWLLNVQKEIETIEIYDWDNPSKKYDRHFVPVPNFLLF